jgi:hypothetical protein
MSSKAQIEANRRNGTLSKGPTTAEGRAISAKNALKHGLLSQEIVLPDEESDAYANMAERTCEEMNPVGELECGLVMLIINLKWRLLRAGRIEAGILAYRYFGIVAQRAVDEMETHVETELDRRKKQEDSQKKVTNVVAYQSAENRLAKMRAEQGTDDASLGLAFIQDSQGGNSLSKLSRYETTIERRLYRAIHELQRLQASRAGKGQNIPTQVIDMDVRGLPDEIGVETDGPITEELEY